MRGKSKTLAQRPVALQGVWLFSLLLVLPLAAGLSIALAALAKSPLASAQGEVPTFGVVESAQRTDLVGATVQARGADPFAISSQSAGIITALHIETGSVLETGVTHVEVDGRPVISYGARFPLFREIYAGLDGEDVTEAQRLLSEVGLLDASLVSGRVDAPTASAIIAFNQKYGYGSDNGILSPSSLLWVPDGTTPPRSVLVRVGARIEQGTDLFEVMETERSVEVRVVPSLEDRVITVGELRASLPAGVTEISEPAFVDHVTTLMGENSSLPATVELAEPRPVGTLPSSSLITDSDGEVCFYSTVGGVGTVVSASAGSYGMTDIDTDLVGVPVLLNPRDMRSDLTCD